MSRAPHAEPKLTVSPSQYPLIKDPLRAQVTIRQTQGQQNFSRISPDKNQLQAQIQTLQRKKRGETFKVPIRETVSVLIGGLEACLGFSPRGRARFSNLCEISHALVGGCANVLTHNLGVTIPSTSLQRGCCTGAGKKRLVYAGAQNGGLALLPTKGYTLSNAQGWGRFGLVCRGQCCLGGPALALADHLVAHC